MRAAVHSSISQSQTLLEPYCVSGTALMEPYCGPETARGPWQPAKQLGKQMHPIQNSRHVRSQELSGAGVRPCNYTLPWGPCYSGQGTLGHRPEMWGIWDRDRSPELGAVRHLQETSQQYRYLSCGCRGLPSLSLAFPQGS